MVDDWHNVLDDNSSSSGSNSGNSSGTGTGTDANATGQKTGDVEIENKFNDFTQYWDGIDDEGQQRISPDAPDVRIYISRQILPEDEEENEADEDAESKIAGLDDPDITKENTTSVKDTTGKTTLAHKSIDDDVEGKVKKITNSYTAYLNSLKPKDTDDDKKTTTTSSKTTTQTGNKKATNKSK